ncbi:MAG: hypothetical protein LBE99_02280 [Puniceicoccales bacterium]|jgi:hypothetical protein|nr:hypothetical protein [Puniceicoccales bacterium]
MSFNNLSSVTYTYPIPRSSTTGEPIATDTNLKATCDGYKNLFRTQYTAIADKLLKALQDIVNLERPSAQHISLSVSMNASCEVTVSQTWPNEGLGDTISREGNRAYTYYLKEIVNDLKAFCGYIKAAGDVLKALDNLNPANGNVNNQAHVLLDELQSQDQLCRKLVIEFSEHFQYNYNGDTWEEAYDAIGFSSPYNITSQLSGSYGSLDALRGIAVNCVNSGGPETKEINTFNELSRLDKLKFIKLYYNLILNHNQPQTVFPDDLRTGYPCLPNEVSTSGTEDTKELGALELFYIGYLIDRDGPINALSSFLEIKTQALRQNISLMMGRIEALNQCLTFINRGLDLLNASQSRGEKKNRIPDATALALRFLCEGTLRGLKTLTINNKKEQYLVLSCNETRTDDGYSLTTSGNYLLVKASADGLAAFLGTELWMNGILPDGTPDPYVCYDGNTDRTGHGTTSNGIHYVVERAIRGNPDRLVLSASDCVASDSGCKIYGKFEYANDIYADSRGNNSLRGETLCLISGQCRVNEFVVYKPTDNANNILFAQFDSPTGDVVKEWLPKAIDVDSILFGSVVHGEDHEWMRANAVDANMVSSWTTAFTNKSEYINTTIESINNDVSTMRTKIDTFDSAASTFRNRAHDTYSGIVGRIG